MLTPIEVTTIDKEKTFRFEDGAQIDKVTGEVIIVSIIPDFSKCNFSRLERALQKRIPRHSSNAYFFDVSHRFLAVTTKTPVFVYRSFPPYIEASICLGEAVLKENYTFEEFREVRESGSDEQVLLLSRYAEEHISDYENPEKIVLLLMNQLNTAAFFALKKTKTPYLSHNNGGISLLQGIPRINRPLRDAVSCIDAAQLAEFLRNGKPLFSKHELEQLIS